MRDDRLRAAPADRGRKDPQIVAGVILPASSRSICDNALYHMLGAGEGELMRVMFDTNTPGQGGAARAASERPAPG
jgi:hypothetical protein